MKPWTHHHIPKPGQSHVTQTVAAHHSTCVSCIMLDSQDVLHCLVFCCIPTLVPMHPPTSWPVTDLCSRWHWREPWFKTSPSSQWPSVHQITTLAGLRGPAADTNRPGCLCPINFLPHCFTLFSACQRGQSGGCWKCLMGTAKWPQGWSHFHVLVHEMKIWSGKYWATKCFCLSSWRVRGSFKSSDKGILRWESRSYKTKWQNLMSLYKDLHADITQLVLNILYRKFHIFGQSLYNIHWFEGF